MTLQGSNAWEMSDGAVFWGGKHKRWFRVKKASPGLAMLCLRWSCKQAMTDVSLELRETSRFPLLLPWELPDCTWISKPKGLLCTNKQFKSLSSRYSLEMPHSFIFQVIILFLLLSLLIHHLFWDTGLESKDDNVHQSALKSSKCSSDACNETSHYFWLLLLWVLWLWIMTSKQEALLVHFSGLTGIWEGGSSPMMLCFIIPWEISFWNMMIML